MVDPTVEDFGPPSGAGSRRKTGSVSPLTSVKKVGSGHCELPTERKGRGKGGHLWARLTNQHRPDGYAVVASRNRRYRYSVLAKKMRLRTQ